MKFRLLCFGYHLLASVVIAVISVCLVFLLWYPAPLDKALGISNIFLLLLCIDVIIGPLLTLLVAKQGKKTLKTDLLTIAVLQSAALAYGLHIVAQGRPVWLVYDVDRFEIVQAYEVVASNDSARKDGSIGWRGPVWMSVLDNVSASVDRKEAYYRADFLRTFDNSASMKVGQAARPLEVLERFNDPENVDLVLGRHPTANAFVPAAGREKSLSVLVNKESGIPIAIVDLSPW